MEKMTLEALDALIVDVEQEFAALAKSASVPAAKEIEAEGSGGDPVKGKLAKEEEKSEDKEEKEEQEEEQEEEKVEKDDLDAAPEMDAPAEEAPEQEQEAPEMEASGDEELDAIYGEMDEEELQAHYEAIMRAAQSKFGAEEAPAMEEQQAAPEMEAPAEQEMQMSEKDEKKEEMAKMAKEIQSLSKSLSDKEEETKKLEETLGRLVKAASEKLPSRKSLTEDDVITKGGSLNKSEPGMTKEQIDEKASKLTRQSLNKSERDVLNKWFVNGHGAEAVIELTKNYKV